MSKQSAGILAYRKLNGIEFFLVHPGGPVWADRDEGAWSIPKGEFDDEDALSAARREFEEETGQEVNGRFIPLKPVKYKDGKKIVYAWAVEGDIDPASVRSNVFPLEWPPKSGKYIDVPEVDRGEWFSYEIARQKILPSLMPLLEDWMQHVMS